MAIWNNFPYVDTHELNLDWLIKEMNDLIDDWKRVQGNVTADAVKAEDASASVSGNLFDGLHFHFELPKGDKGDTGEQGPQGPSGNDFTIIALVASTSDLPATGQPGDAYAVGTAASNTVYIWDSIASDWVDVGPIVGPEGPQGPTGATGATGATGPYFTPAVSSAGIISWTNNGGLTNPASQNIKGPQGIQGPTGPEGPIGHGLEILDLYATLADLQTDHPTGTPGDCYAVGTANNNTLYIWSESQTAWIELGSVQIHFVHADLPVDNLGSCPAGGFKEYAFSLPVGIDGSQVLSVNGIYNYNSGNPMIKEWHSEMYDNAVFVTVYNAGSFGAFSPQSGFTILKVVYWTN